MKKLSRANRVLIVFACGGALASVLIAPRLFPHAFSGESSIGYVADYHTTDLVARSAGMKLSDETWAKVQSSCAPDQFRMRPVYSSDVYTDEVFCRTTGDKLRTLLSYLVALLLFPAVALVIGWILKGSRDQ